MSNQPPYGGPPPQGPPPYQGPPQQYGPPPQQYAGPPPQYGAPQYGPPGSQQWGPPPQGPGFGWGSNGFPPPPKKKSKAGWIVLPIVVVVAGVVGLFLWSQVSKGSDDDYTSPQPTYTSTYEPTTAPTYSRTSTRPTTRPTTTRTTPSVPEPSDSDIVTKNRIYKTGVQRTVNCRESGARANSAANARKYYAALLACLNKAWPRQVAMSGKTFAAPRLIAFTGPVSTPCSGNAPSSFYCSANRTIYMDAAGDMKYFQTYSRYPNRTQAMAWIRAEMTDTVAHEYGHHLQNLTGILRASNNIEYEKSGDAALQMSRRLEIQATCLGNVFIGANKSSYKMSGLLKSQLDYLHSHSGDEYGSRRDHGSRAVIPRWANAGFVTRNPGSCNTYVAAATYVR
ncbi:MULTISPECIES: neutral zinc metallopeptidase [unclassified Kribbella]|uniref:neutral zinc metallopeptidase n=1 Tax=unclassified Kribbella TaxID=2644121 RepID=UPI003015A41C